MSENKYNGEKIDQGEKQQQNLGVWGGGGAAFLSSSGQASLKMTTGQNF